jgi:hypothetical protein
MKFLYQDIARVRVLVSLKQMAREEQSETEWQQKTLNEILLQSFN